MVDTHDSKSCLARGEGSSPSSGTMEKVSVKNLKDKGLESESLPKAIIICGPTETGKSDLAVLLAKRFNGEIISADSRQVYKGLDLGSGKITKKEMQGVPHFMLDVADPKRTYTVDKFSKEALKISKEIIKKNKTPIICGGTGMYIDSLVEGVEFPQVKPNRKLRKELELLSTENLYQKLIKLDYNRSEQLKNNGGGQFNRVRLIRSIEIATEIGSVPPRISHKNFEAFYIGLDFDDKTLKEKIKLRIEYRMKKGMLNEARNLHKNGLSYKRMRELGLEYKYLADILENKITKEEFNQNLAQDTWHFAKRQRTWFKKRQDTLWFKPSKTTLKKIEILVKKFINGKNRSTIS